jgi:hypothetical protein
MCRRADRRSGLAAVHFIVAPLVSRAEGSIVLVGRRADGSPSGMDILHQSDANGVARAAWDFLTEHRSCGLVELWSAERCVGTLRREDGSGGLLLTETLLSGRPADA